MILIFLISTLIIALSLYFNRNTLINYALLALHSAVLWYFVIYEFVHLNEFDLEYFKPDALGILLLFAIAILTIPVFYHSYKYIENQEKRPKSRALFFAAMVVLISACSVAYISNHIAVTWIFVEITTLCASLLIYHHRNIRALEGAWKYAFICAISVTFVYIGILFLSLSFKKAGINDMSFDSLSTHIDKLNPFWLKLSFLFIFTGFTAKLGLVPMFTAGIDAKDKAPGPAGALFASVVMNLGFVGIYRIYAIVAHTPLKYWANTIMIIAALFSIFIAAVYITRVKNIKRLFAYSGIEHMGLVILGLAAGGIGIYAAILHIILHSLVKPCLFFQYNQIYNVFQSKSIYDMGNYFKYNKSGSIVLLLGFFSATAMPPSGLFISEFLIFQALFQAHYIIIMFAVLVLLTIIIFGFGSNVAKVLFTHPISIDELAIPKISQWESLSQYVLLALAAYLAYNPPATLVSLIQDAVKLVL